MVYKKTEKGKLLVIQKKEYKNLKLEKSSKILNLYQHLDP